MFREQEMHRQTLGIWGPAARAWIDYEPSRAAAFPLATGGQQRVHGFPPGTPTPDGRELCAGARPSLMVRRVVAAVADQGLRGVPQQGC